MARLLGCAALLAWTLGACATAGERDPMTQLQRAVDGYNEAFRWKNFERASAWLAPDRRAGFVSAHEDDEKSLHVDEYQVLSVDTPAEGEAEVTVRVTFTLLPDVTVQTRKLKQRWRKLDAGWMLEREEHSIRALDAEPPARPATPEAPPPAPLEPGPEGFGGEDEAGAPP
jgi:hypothetical protein